MTGERAGTGVTWARVEDGFHVGSRRGDFLGYIDRQPDGAYFAYDARSAFVGSFDTLVAAMAATAATEPPAELRQIW